MTKKQRMRMKIKGFLSLLFLLALFIAVIILIYKLFSKLNPVKDVTVDDTGYTQLEGLPTQEEAEEEARKEELRAYEIIFEEKEEYPIDMILDTPNFVMFDANTKEILYSKNGNEKIYPASTTKIMTAALVMRYAAADTVFTAGDELDLVQAGSSLAGLTKGSQLDRDMILDALMIQSGNDASYTAAATVGRLIAGEGGEELSAKEAVKVFVDEMNRTAEEIGCKNTHFTCPDGFHDEDHYTTALDMLRITIYSERFPEIAASGAKIYREPTFLSGETVEWYNSNALLPEDNDYYYMYAKGLKTGMTNEAGYCVVATAKRFDHELIIVSMGAETQSIRWLNTIAMFDQGFVYVREHGGEE
ncbi:MAG: D-alanyl-D-alanine carboxypeptidase [Oscillospiraceae bacterium]|nr:D-alanyl-D-alanine carboxypeptidase [Oscillospiraceae bacterium]MBQ8978927.1 D-alanyl-D-alanine carboxypeptidase [Oscillospiraceae bacterium]